MKIDTVHFTVIARLAVTLSTICGNKLS